MEGTDLARGQRILNRYWELKALLSDEPASAPTRSAKPAAPVERPASEPPPRPRAPEPRPAVSPPLPQDEPEKPAAETYGDPPAADDTPSPPPPENERKSGGTVLIPAGQARRADAPEPEPESDDEAPASAGDAEGDAPTDAVGTADATPDVTDDAATAPSVPPAVRPPSSLPGMGSQPGVGSQPSIGSGGSIPGDVIEAARRRERLEKRKRRLRLGAIFGGMGAAIVLVVVILFVVLNQRSEQSGAFFAAHTAAVTVIEETNAPIFEVIEGLEGSEKPDLSALETAVADAREAMANLALPSAEGRFEGDAQRLSDAVEMEVAFLDQLVAITEADAVEFDDDMAVEIRNAWADVIDAFNLTYADNDGVDPPSWRSFETQVAAFAGTIESAGERARRIAAELEALNEYHSAVLPVLQAFDTARSAIDSYNGSAKVMEEYTDRDAFRTRFNTSSDTFQGLADQMSALSPPSEFRGPHSGLVNVFQGWADATGAATAAASEASCEFVYEDSDFGFGSYEEVCEAAGDTPTYRSYLSTRSRLIGDADRLRGEWSALYDSELRRLQEG